MADEIRAGKRHPRDFAIFYRVNALSRSLEFALRHHGIPYQMVNGLEFYQRKEIKDVLAYLRLINNPRDDNALLRIINMPPRGIGKGTIDRLLSHASQQRLTLLEAARESGLIAPLAKRAAVAVARFVAMIDRMSLLAASPVEEILGHVLTESGYRALLEQSEDEDDQERLANLEELLTAAGQFDEQHHGENSLEGFLEEASLVADVDAWDADTDRATLMTLHASKGLEFPVVFIIALEKGLMPHERSRSDDDAVEEERRLLFVGMTRAEDELQLSMGQYREFRGQRRMTIPSPFMLELPRHELRMVGFGPQTAGEYRARGREMYEGDEAAEPEHVDAERWTLSSTNWKETCRRGAIMSRPTVRPRAYCRLALGRRPPGLPNNRRWRWPPRPRCTTWRRGRRRPFRPTILPTAWWCGTRNMAWAKSSL